MIQAAIVGLGRWGQRIVESVHGRSTRLAIGRGMVRHPSAVSGFAQRHGIALTDDWQAILEDNALDAVLLATPHTLHAAQTVDAARAGKHVFCEKPLALDRADAWRAVRACAENGRVLAVGHDKRFWPSMIALREVVRSGALGTVLHVEGHTSNQHAGAFTAWREKPEESPAGGMTGAGIHMLDALIALCGPVTEVEARHAVHGDRAARLDSVAVLLSFKCGVTGTLATVRSTPFYWRAHVFGDRASAEALGPTTLLVRGPDDKVECREFRAVDQVLAEVDAFADAAAGEKPFPVTTDEMLATAAAFEAIVASVATRRAVQVAA